MRSRRGEPSERLVNARDASRNRLAAKPTSRDPKSVMLLGGANFRYSDHFVYQTCRPRYLLNGMRCDQLRRLRHHEGDVDPSTWPDADAERERERPRLDHRRREERTRRRLTQTARRGACCKSEGQRGCEKRLPHARCGRRCGGARPHTRSLHHDRAAWSSSQTKEAF